MLFQNIPVIMGAILAAAVRMMQETLGRPFGFYCPEQGLADQVSGQSVSHRIADDIAIKEILVASYV